MSDKYYDPGYHEESRESTSTPLERPVKPERPKARILAEGESLSEHYDRSAQKIVLAGVALFLLYVLFLGWGYSHPIKKSALLAEAPGISTERKSIGNGGFLWRIDLPGSHTTLLFENSYGNLHKLSD